ncbi:MAG: protein-lysine N-methyltransferase [Rhizobacter sp.]|nr:protein-lysine N-methyltransferase [Rhizobacter sp.]
MTQAGASKTSKPIAKTPLSNTPGSKKTAKSAQAAASDALDKVASRVATKVTPDAADRKPSDPKRSAKSPKSADGASKTVVEAAGKAAGKTAKRTSKTAKVTQDEPVYATDRIRVTQSGVHGKGVFATALIAKGERIIEYKGEVISWPEALRRHPHDPSQPNHTFYFHVDDETVIDGNVDGNDSKWINHACKPNCEAEDDSGRIFIDALRNIKAGEELFFDYRLVIDERYTKKLKKEYECRCGFANCRHTMLGPK